MLTQLGGNTRQWQEKLRELADSHYDLQNVKLLVTGGDGSAWASHNGVVMGQVKVDNKSK